MLVAFVLFLILLIKLWNAPSISNYQSIEPIAVHTNGQSFAGSDSCVECHKDIYDSHIKTAHFNSSAIANENNIKGSFESGKNTYHLNDDIMFIMETKDAGFYQETFSKKDSSLIASDRIDIVIGSGTKGQTYLNWKENELYQLQVSYFEPTNSWINSPKYPDKILASDRPIQGRCLECHVTFAERTPAFNKRNIYDKSQMVYGIDCERCHGPAAEHVNLHRNNPEENNPLGILSYSNLSRQQKLENCALCHSGVRTQAVKNPFSFVVGDTLIKHSIPDYDEESLQSLDVHGNQYGLISASKCFVESKTMDCATCHNIHEKERGNTALFNSRCINCHSSGQNVECALNMGSRVVAENNCIKCHMPLTLSKGMVIDTTLDSIATPVQVRTHFIGIYSDETVADK